MLRVFEKILALLVVAPPLFITVRYLRWYFRDKKREEREAA